MRLLSLIAFVLIGVAPLFADAPKKVLLVSQGPDGHPALTHEYAAGLKVLEKCLRAVPGLEITTANGDEPWKEGPDLLPRADAVVLFVSEGAKWIQNDPKRFEALKRLAAQKGGLVVLHWGMGTRDAKYIDGCLELLGGCHGGPDRKYQVLETETRVVDPKHPIVAGVGPVKLKEEFYYQLKFTKAEGVQPILQAKIDGDWHTVAWAWQRPSGGRSFGFSGLHFHDNWKLPEYRRMVTQAVSWTLDVPVPKEGLPVEVAADDLKIK